MNRLVVALLSVLTVLVAAHGIIVWRAGEQAHEDAKRQACIEGTQATATVALMAPALVAPSDESKREAQIDYIRALSTQLDAC